MRELTITKNEANQRLDKYLAKYMNLAPKSFFYKMMRKKNITLNGKKADGSEKLQVGDTIKLFLADETIDKFSESKKPVVNQKSKIKAPKLQIIYEDENVLIINKPVGMLSQKADKKDVSLVEYIIDYLLTSGKLTEDELRTFKPSVCNRLDRNTSGLITAGKTLSGLQDLSEAFKKRTLRKYYRCLVKGEVKETSHIDGYLVKDEVKNKVFISKTKTDDASRIETEYRPIRSRNGYTLLEVHLITGKPHQIRAHLASIHHPILGDFKYGDQKINQKIKEKYGLKSQILHAYRLEFPQMSGSLQPLSGKTIIGELPKDFERIIHEIIGE